MLEHAACKQLPVQHYKTALAEHCDYNQAQPPYAKSGNDTIVLSRFSTYLQHPDICVNIAEIAADKESIRWLVSDFILI